MYVAVIITLVFLLIFLQPFLNEFWTILQIFKSFFVRRIDLKRRYGPWAVVTGCTDGIGKFLAFELANRGLNIVLISRNTAKLNDVAGEIQQRYKVETKIVTADFSKGREIYQEIEDELKSLDIGVLVNNVGIQYSYPMYFGELPEDELWGLLNVNIGSVTQMTRIVLPKMVLKKRGAIVNLSSGSKLQPLPFMNLYAASKIFVDYYTEALRCEYRNSGLSIQCLCPYYISTKINHFSDKLTKVNIFIPTAERYSKSALDTLGVIDNTTGYWPHRFQYLLFSLTPPWVKTYLGGLIYKKLRHDYLKSNPKVVSEERIDVFVKN